MYLIIFFFFQKVHTNIHITHVYKYKEKMKEEKHGQKPFVIAREL